MTMEVVDAVTPRGVIFEIVRARRGAESVEPCGVTVEATRPAAA